MKTRLIVIDDEIDFCRVVYTVFTKKGFEVFLFHSLQDGLHGIETKRPDIVILDNDLPDGLGWKQSKNLSKKFPNIQFHLVSAFEDGCADKKRLAGEKMFYWQKPMKLEELSRFLG